MADGAETCICHLGGMQLVQDFLRDVLISNMHMGTLWANVILWIKRVDRARGRPRARARPAYDDASSRTR